MSESTMDFAKNISRIKCLVLDVDGILTDCRIWLDQDGEWKRFFSIRDGYGMLRLHQAGYKLGIITASKAKDIAERACNLKVDFFYQGNLDKLPAFEDLKKKANLQDFEIAYMGDDLFDLPLLDRVGFSATAPEAMEDVKSKVHYVTERPGGNGCVREVCELILKYGPLKSVDPGGH